jgi:hypothetical protein
MDSIAAHVRAMLELKRMGAVTFDYGNNIRRMAADRGVAAAFEIPGFVPEYIRPMFCELGFTHICSTIHKTGRFTVKRKTIGKRMAAKLKDIKAPLRRRMHESVAEQGTWLGSVVRGYFNYHAIPGNFPRLRSFHHDVVRHWWQVLRRRSQRPLRWETFGGLVTQYLPTPAILHPYPLERFCAKHPR